MSWIADEVAGCRLKDQRLKPRLERIVERLSAKPTASIPAACRGWGETQATYRFLSNERVEAEEILEGHSQATIQRIAAEPVALLVQDTTLLEYIKDVVGKGVGTLRETSREEHLLHPSVTFTPAQVNLGVLTYQFGQRPEEPVGHLRAQRPIEEKESYRWLLGYGVACEVQRRCPQTLVVSVADREGDIHEWFLDAAERAEEEQATFVIRAKCNRRVEAQPQDTYGWEALREAPVLGQTTVEVSEQAGRTARQARLTVRRYAVTFNWGGRRGSHLPPVQVQAVYAKEDSPPPGEDPGEWMLLTNLPLADFKTAELIIAWYWYWARWKIDPLTRWLKDGIVVGDGGYLSQAKATELTARGVYLLTTTRKNMRHVASQFQLACLQLRHRVEEIFAFLKNAFGAVRTTHRVSHALPITYCAVYWPILSTSPGLLESFYRESRAQVWLQRFAIVINGHRELEERVRTASLLLDEHRDLQDVSRSCTTALIL